MTLVETVRALITKREQLASELSAIDQELAEVRMFFVGLDAPAADTPMAVVAPEAPKEIDRRGEQAVCRGCGTTFTPKAKSAGAYCSRACFENPNRATRSRNASKPSEPAALRAKDYQPKPALLERRCVERRCLKKFKPTTDGQIYCTDCLEKKGKALRPTSWHATATKADDRFETVWNGGEGLSGVGGQKGRES